ncbi:MAG TPA: hypothetical protein PLY81_07370 [Chitinophagaceae bacterium]|nr:hypothetical protein [Chitinophagaceae bacterium]
MRKSKNKSLYNIFVGYLTKKGNKIKAKKILDVALLTVARKFNLSIRSLLIKVLKRVGCVVELKTIRMRKNTHIVPFAINQTRKYYLTVRRIMEAVAQDTTNRPITDKLVDELTSILILSKSSRSLKKSKTDLKDAVVHRSNIHFRW